MRMLNKKKAVAKAPAPKKTAGPAHAPAKPAAKKPAPKVAPKPAPKATKKPAGAKPAVKKSKKTALKKQHAKKADTHKKAKKIEKKPAPKAAKKPAKKPAPKATKKPAGGKKPAVSKKIKAHVEKQHKEIANTNKKFKNVEKTNTKQKKGKNPKIKSLPHPKKNLKLALKGVSNGGKVGKNLDYSKLVVDALHKYHELAKATKKKDTKKINEVNAWVKKNTHMDVKKFMKRFKLGSKKIKIEVLTNGSTQGKGHIPKELRAKLDHDSMADELHKFRIGEARGRVMPKKIRNTLKKIKGGKITDTKIGHIGGYHYLFVYVHQNTP